MSGKMAINKGKTMNSFKIGLVLFSGANLA
jgi:hypothetical protein